MTVYGAHESVLRLAEPPTSLRLQTKLSNSHREHNEVKHQSKAQVSM